MFFYALLAMCLYSPSFFLYFHFKKVCMRACSWAGWWGPPLPPPPPPPHLHIHLHHLHLHTSTLAPLALAAHPGPGPPADPPPAPSVADTPPPWTTQRRGSAASATSVSCVLTRPYSSTLKLYRNSCTGWFCLQPSPISES